MAQHLRSDHVNYLIWRYLQENGFGKAAVQLSREWSNENPQSLPFATDIKPHALISLLQDGLNYDDLLSRVQPTEAQLGLVPSYKKRYTFVIDRKRPAEGDLNDARLNLTEIANGSRKKQKLDPTANDQHTPSTSRPSSRRTKSTKTQALQTQPNGDRMDVDEEEESRQQELQEEAQEPRPPTPIIATLDVGASVGMQSEETVDLKLARGAFDFDIPSTDILSCRWNYTDDPLAFTVTGGSIWQSFKLPIQSIKDEPENNEEFLVEPTAIHLGPNTSNFFVSATDEAIDMDVSSSTPTSEHDKSTFRAYACEDSAAGQTCSRLMLETSPKSTPLITTLDTILFVRFNPDRKLLLAGSTNQNGGGLISLYDVERLNLFNRSPLKKSLSRPIAIFETPKIALTATFSRSDKIIACGEEFIAVYSVPSQRLPSDEAIPTLKSEHNSISTDKTWEFLTSCESKVACASPDSAYLGLLSTDDLSFVSKQAHEQQITSLLWQPRPPTFVPDKTSLLASSSTDGTVKLWKAEDVIECVHVLQMDPWVPAMALAFNRKGQYVAAAGAHRVKVWNIGDESALRDTVNGEMDRSDNKESNLLVAHWTAAEDEEDQVAVARSNPTERPVSASGANDQPSSNQQTNSNGLNTKSENPSAGEAMQVDAEIPVSSIARDEANGAPPENPASPKPQTGGGSVDAANNSTVKMDMDEPGTNPETANGQANIDPSNSDIPNGTGDTTGLANGDTDISATQKPEEANRPTPDLQNGGDESAPPFHTLSFNAHSELLAYTYGHRIHIINVAAQCADQETPAETSETQKQEDNGTVAAAVTATADLNEDGPSAAVQENGVVQPGEPVDNTTNMEEPLPASA